MAMPDDGPALGLRSRAAPVAAATGVAPLPPLDADTRIAVIGLGYVGLPLAVALGARWPVVGFDIDAGRIAELRAGADRTEEVTPDELARARRLTCSGDAGALGRARIYIVTVPTPIDAHKRPDLSALLAASAAVGRVLKRGDLVVYESTVYPGATEEACVPALETVSGLRLGRDFHVGYSPERINPGDREHRLPTIQKVVAASSPEAAALLEALYGAVVPAGIHRAESIRVAEAGKVIENTQRDLNIALVNELAIICNRLGIDTDAVLRAAGTKWNFLPFRPGLVGGHCIGVDPYYLTWKAEATGYHPEIILAGRRLNDGMAAYAAGRMIKAMLRRRIQIEGARVLVLGLTFKENCPDLRNTKVADLVRELAEFGARVEVHDPRAAPAEAARHCGLGLLPSPPAGSYDGVVLAVAHDEYRAAGAAALRRWGREGHVFFDLKSVFARHESDLRL